MSLTNSPKIESQTLPNIDLNESPGYYIAFLTIFALCYYILNISFCVRYTETILPFSDPFTYTAGFFNLLDMLEKDYLSTIKRILVGQYNWYWLPDLTIALFSPFLIKEPFSLSIINFFIYWLASLSFFRLSRVLGGSMGFSFLAGMLVWIFPINYGFDTHSSIPVLTLDSIYSGALFIVTAHTLIFLHSPEKPVNAVLAGCAFGVAVWGRGNSLPVVGMIAFAPISLVIHRAFKEKSRALIKNISFFTLTAIGLTGHFYWANWAPLKEYYAHHATLATMSAWTLENAWVWLLNIPGFMFWREESSTLTVAITIGSHLLLLFTLWLTFFGLKNQPKEIQNRFKQLAITGAFIYIVTYAINMFFFIDPMLTIYNVILIYRPMLCGMILFFIILTWFIFNRFDFLKSQHLPYATLVVMLAFAMFFTTKQTNFEKGKGRPSPREVEAFSQDIDKMLKGGTLSILWYGNYNPQIIGYYRLKNDLKGITIQTGKHYNGMWAFFDYSEAGRLKTRQEIKNQFEKAAAIIIPENLDLYYQHQPYPLYKFREEVGRYLNAPDSPKFVVIKTLKEDVNGHLLVLKRADLANGQGTPLKLPYGFKKNVQ